MLAQTGNLAQACRESGTNRTEMLALRRRNALFDRAWDDALDAAADELELEARRRGALGDTNYVIASGRVVSKPGSDEPVVIKRYSDRLLELLLRAHRPEKFSNAPARRETGCSQTEIANDPDPPRALGGAA